MTKLFDRVAIAGVGLIGGSLGLAAKKAGLVGELIGLGRTRSNLDVALARGLVDRVTQDPCEAVRDADAVVLAVPVAAMAPLAARMAPALRAGAVVTDVGSVKARVVREMRAALPAAVHFVGAHPIAGTEDSGAAAARLDLFRGAPCVLTPTPETNTEALEKIRALWRGVGGEVEELTPERHDEILAWVSHVPHMLAFALVNACPSGAPRFAGPSFRDATRVAASDTTMWRDIALYNGDAIVAALRALADGLERLRDAIERGDGEALTKLFAEARAARQRIEDERS